MKVEVFDDLESLSVHTAGVINDQVLRKPNAVLCLATGNTPVRTYELMVRHAKEKTIDYTRVRFVELDEWVGIPPSTPGGCYFFLNQHLFKPLNIDRLNVYLFDALSDDLSTECDKMDTAIRMLGGIDLMLVGVGMNGHVGFNEPGVSVDLYSHVVDLDQTTRKVGQKYFKNNMLLQQGITLGLRHFLQARTAIVLANGEAKAAVMRQALKEEISPNLPAAQIRKHPNGYVYIDEAAASQLDLGKLDR